MAKKKDIGGSGRSARTGDINNVSGQIGVGEGITQIGKARDVIIYQEETKKKSKDELAADQVRQYLRGIIKNSHKLSTLLTDGSLLITNSSAITKEFRSRLGLAATHEDFWKYLRSDEGLMLSVALEGWNSSGQTAQFEEIINQLEQTSLFLRGQLLIVSYAKDILIGIAHDAYSPLIFTRVLSSAASTEFSQENKNKQDIGELINALTVYLQSNAASYFQVRYEDAVKQLDDFIKTTSYEFIDLKDVQLIRASKTESKQAIASPTRTGSMKILLNDLKADFPKETYDKMFILIDQLEKSTSKEIALDKLEHAQHKEVN